ncbi:MAG: hypothetical protein IT223_02335 [Crocinitomicaceae bacterium]|nr:hypothetical protein [Crocinitomicaceae bacterium]
MKESVQNTRPLEFSTFQKNAVRVFLWPQTENPYYRYDSIQDCTTDLLNEIKRMVRPPDFTNKND